MFENQFGFRPNHSTDMAIIKLVDKIVQATNANQTTAGVFLDLSKAFDTISHNILLSKMEHYGIRGVALDWFKNYLTNRSQFVEYNGHISKIKTINTGMPQGSILGPLGFIIYVNDIPNSVPDLSFILFADDTSAFTSHQNINTLNNIINSGISKLSLWFMANKLSLNPTKTNVMLFGTRNKISNINTNFELSLNGQVINRVDAFKFLGVTVDQNLTWNQHINNLSKKCSSSIGILYKIKRYLPETALITLYNTLVTSHITYGITAWSSANVTNKTKLHILQKRELKAISNSEFRCPSNPLFIKFNQLKVFDLCNLYVGSFMYKYCNNLLPCTFDNIFTSNQDNHNYNTRNASNFQFPKNRLEFGNKSICYQGVKTWNDIPYHIKNANSLNSFKCSFKDNTLHNYKQIK